MFDALVKAVRTESNLVVAGRIVVVAEHISDVVGCNPQGVPSLDDVLSTLAAYWVLCGCGIEILDSECNGLERKIDSLRDQIPQIEATYDKEAMPPELAILEAQSEALNDEWEQAHDEADAYCEMFGEACEFWFIDK